jgi:hypothetical protein
MIWFFVIGAPALAAVIFILSIMFLWVLFRNKTNKIKEDDYTYIIVCHILSIFTVFILLKINNIDIDMNYVFLLLISALISILGFLYSARSR